MLQHCGMPAKLDDIDNNLRQAIAKRLKELRKETGKTQQDFAHGSGRDKQSYHKNESGKGTSIYAINKFCMESDITLMQFFNSPLFQNEIKNNK